MRDRCGRGIDVDVIQTDVTLNMYSTEFDFTPAQANELALALMAAAKRAKQSRRGKGGG